MADTGDDEESQQQLVLAGLTQQESGKGCARFREGSSEAQVLGPKGTWAHGK